MAELPIMPTATDALIADTTHMSAEEFGAYWRVLCAMWRNGAKLTYSADALARIAGVSRERWDAIEGIVLAPIKREGDILTQKRMTSTWLKVQMIKTKRALAAESRWGRRR